MKKAATVVDMKFNAKVDPESQAARTKIVDDHKAYKCRVLKRMEVCLDCPPASSRNRRQSVKAHTRVGCGSSRVTPFIIMMYKNMNRPARAIRDYLKTVKARNPGVRCKSSELGLPTEVRVEDKRQEEADQHQKEDRLSV